MKVVLHDKPSVEAVLAHLNSPIRRFAARYPAERDDMAQEGRIGVIRAYSRWDHTRGVPANAYCWYRAKGAMLDHARFRHEQPKMFSLDVAEEERYPSPGDPYAPVIAKITLEWVYSLCSKTERQVIDLYRRGLTYAEIATARGTSQSAVARAMDSVRERVQTAPLRPSPPPPPPRRPQEIIMETQEQQSPVKTAPSGRLRPEHIQVLQDLANGQTLEQIAKRDFISRDALKSRLALIARHMGLPSARQIDLVVAAMRDGLIS